MVSAGSRNYLITITVILWFVVLSSCTFSEQANCTRDEDCVGTQRCLQSGGLLVREGVCVDRRVQRDLDAGKMDIGESHQDVGVGSARDADAEEEIDIVDDVDTTAECPLNQALCQETCVVLAENVEHCGECDRACPSGFLCRDGECGCPHDICSGECVDISESLEYCGGCDSPCSTQIPDAEVHCSDGQCVVECSEYGRTPCAEQGLCADLDSDPQNCGACGEECPDNISGAKSVCISGECGYECDDPSQTLCEDEGLCTDIDVDRQHCGACGDHCQFFLLCVNGECIQT